MAVFLFLFLFFIHPQHPIPPSLYSISKTYIQLKFKCCYRNMLYIYIFYCSPLCMYKERSPSSTTPFFIIIFPLLLLLLTTPFHNVKNIKNKKPFASFDALFCCCCCSLCFTVLPPKYSSSSKQQVAHKKKSLYLC